MTANPYESPKSEAADIAASEEGSTSTRAQPHKGALITLVVGWNIPVVVNFYLLIAGRISEHTSDLLMAWWCTTIPLLVLLFAYVPAAQRWLFTCPIDQSRRSTALGVAGLWSVLSGGWLYSLLT